MDNRRNYYRILQVQPDAPFEIIRTSYLTILHKLKQHPDLGGDHSNAKILNEAYQTLSDAKKRAEYDKKLFAYYTKHFSSGERSSKKPVTTVFCPFCKRPLARKESPDKNCICQSNSFFTEQEESTREECRRSLARIKKLEKLHFISPASKKVQQAQLVDLSPEGMRFLCKKKQTPNVTIKIDSSLFHATAKVMNTQKIVLKGRVFYSVGTHFLSVFFTNQDGTFLSATV
ncbi:MAG: J domain-containing protein [Candidatus Scalindua sp.]|nr:J domain-containing protein [Candidatus Scalindua sp.]